MQSGIHVSWIVWTLIPLVRIYSKAHGLRAPFWLGVHRFTLTSARRRSVMMLATIIKTIFIDVRPCDHAPMGVGFVQGSLTALPISDNSVPSLSCLSVAEHIGPGRYDDTLDPQGTQHAARELMRVLAPGGALYFSVPVGCPRGIIQRATHPHRATTG